MSKIEVALRNRIIHSPPLDLLLGIYINSDIYINNDYLCIYIQ
jgi:hypothetical protein